MTIDYFGNEEAERAALYKLFASVLMREPDEETSMSVKAMLGSEFTETQKEIAEDFRGLFRDHLRPYESLYNYPLGDRPRLRGRAAEKVQEIYRSAGLVIDEEIDLIPDHLSVELLFMSYLIERGLLDEQKSFLEEHLLQWVPAFCDEIKKHARTTFYREVADMLKELLSSDHDEFEG